MGDLGLENKTATEFWREVLGAKINSVFFLKPQNIE